MMASICSESGTIHGSSGAQESNRSLQESQLCVPTRTGFEENVEERKRSQIPEENGNSSLIQARLAQGKQHQHQVEYQQCQQQQPSNQELELMDITGSHALQPNSLSAPTSFGTTTPPCLLPPLTDNINNGKWVPALDLSRHPCHDQELLPYCFDQSSIQNLDNPLDFHAPTSSPFPSGFQSAHSLSRSVPIPQLPCSAECLVEPSPFFCSVPCSPIHLSPKHPLSPLFPHPHPSPSTCAPSPLLPSTPAHPIAFSQCLPQPTSLSSLDLPDSAKLVGVCINTQGNLISVGATVSAEPSSNFLGPDIRSSTFTVNSPSLGFGSGSDPGTDSDSHCTFSIASQLDTHPLPTTLHYCPSVSGIQSPQPRERPLSSISEHSIIPALLPAPLSSFSIGPCPSQSNESFCPSHSRRHSSLTNPIVGIYESASQTISKGFHYFLFLPSFVLLFPCRL
ncbi:hypothetical protein BCR41DRAFT_75255 [Lobosporangium transversale]|uniref:Uncharacterized protein n=1 Tax=Lobosporangium transversale TaxID=64571 RepID=A0A1Y2H464_9FUNG|nr:hypothetical protein BCR41DRAFT_75255 [Lobosporangium transversale]ORZ28503.1 hypothetical protein BCR41DRAFT_75255 [Lobosporangium transversale]|eukprot:XP_021886188.1 hypothetical protein BCR41DRAFT_75255 [Lobosporangium transversale]